MNVIKKLFKLEINNQIAKKIKILNLIFIFIFFGMSFSYQTFEVDKGNLVGADEVNEDGFDFVYEVFLAESKNSQYSSNENARQNFAIRNTGSSNLSLSLTSTTMRSGSNSFNITLSASRITNLIVGSSSSQYFEYNISENQNLGEYTGTLSVISGRSSSQTRTLNVKFILKPQERNFTLSDGEKRDELEENEIQYDFTYDSEIDPVYQFKNLNVSITNKNTFQKVNIQNSQKDTLDFNITKVDLVNEENSSQKISINLLENQIKNLEPGKSSSFTFSIEIPDNTQNGTYVGSISVFSVFNTSIKKDLKIKYDIKRKEDLRLNVTSKNVSKKVISSNEEVLSSFIIENIGDRKIEDVKFEFENRNEDENSENSIYGVNFGEEFKFSFLDFKTEGFDIETGIKKEVRFLISVPEELREDVYQGNLVIYSENGIKERVLFSIDVKQTSDQIKVLRNEGDAKNGIIKIDIDSKRSYSNLEFFLENLIEKISKDFTLRIEDNFSKKNSNDTISKDIVSFKTSNFELDKKAKRKILFDIQIDEDYEKGEYSSFVKVVKAGKEILNIPIILNILPKVYISKFEIDQSIKPGEVLDLKVKINNFDFEKKEDLSLSVVLKNSLNEELINQDTNLFSLENGEEKEYNLKIRIPKSLEYSYNVLSVELLNKFDETLHKRDTQILVADPLQNQSIRIKENYLNSFVYKCQDSALLSVVLQNIKEKSTNFENEISYKIGYSVIGGKSFESNEEKISNNLEVRKTFDIDIKDLSSGNYELETYVEFNGNKISKRQNFKIENCENKNLGSNFKEEKTTNKAVLENEVIEYKYSLIETFKKYWFLIISFAFLILFIFLFFFFYKKD